MNNKTQTGPRYNFVPVLLAVSALIVFLVLLYPIVKAVLEESLVEKELKIHQLAIEALLSRKSELLSECDKALTETDRIKKLQTEENIKLERAQGALKTAEELRTSVVAEQMRFENIQRDLMATNQAIALKVFALRAESSELNQNLIAVRTNHSTYKAQISSLLLEKKTLEDGAITLHNDIQTLQAQRDQYLRDAKTQRQDYVQNEEAGRNALVSLRKAEATLAQVTADVTAQIKRNASLEQEAVTLTQSVAEATKQITDLKTQAAKENEALKTVRTEADAARIDFVAHAAQLTQLKTDIQTESKRKETLIVDSKGLTQATVEASKRLKDVQTQLATETEKLKAIQSDVDAARASHMAYTVQTEQLKMDIAKLRTELAKSKNVTK